jgi:hypothetical protein
VKLRLLGFVLTVVAVVVLLGSLVAGLGPSTGEPAWEEFRLPYPPQAPRERIRVEVLNGAGIAGLAREVTEQLRSEGFDVVHYGNAQRGGVDSTAVLDRIGDRQAAEAVASALGVGRIQTALDTALYLEATVILGRDFPDVRERLTR